MASPGKFQTYQAVGNREDLTDVISNITPMDTWFMSNTGNTDASATYHENQIDTLAAAAANAAVEGADATAADLSATSRVGNYCQILQKTYAVSMTQEKVTSAGRSSEIAYQTAKKMKELARDIEYALLINASAVSGASGTARQMKGVLGWLTSNVTTGTATGNEALTESMFNDNLQLIWASGGVPPFTTLCGAFQKRKFDAFTTNTRYAMADENKLASAVNVYESSFGVVTIRLHHILNTSSAGTLITLGDMDLWKKAWLRRTKRTKLAVTGDSEKFQLLAELTLESRNQAGSGKITGLTTS